ncbi:MAG: EAL domain-containing protein, partial [Burkholderiales bacterium]|nr:EAL domain-containing protein [Burkholderiales bacterium]
LQASATGDALLVEAAALLAGITTGAEVRSSADQRHLLGFARLTGPGWHLVTVYPVQAARAVAVDNAQGIVVVGAGVALLGVALLVAILRSQVGQPLRTLIGATEHLEDGRLDVRVPESGRHELARLGQSFNRMAERIESRDRQLTQLARQDALTGLPNRFHLLGQLEERIVQCRTSGGRLALIFIDLDRFKGINDALGHSVGDALLRRVAALFLAQARGDDFVARLGGDEFVVLVHDTVDVHLAAERLAARLVEALRTPIEVDGFTLHTTPSLGISLFPEDADDAETLVRKADIAMYRAKAEGRNGWRFYEALMDDVSVEALEMGNALRQALVQQELVLHFQPRVRLADRCIVGCEALIRWNRPGHGLLLPGSFLPLLQEIGLMPELNRYVLEAACAQLGAWRRAGLPAVAVAVNLTPDFCLDAGMADEVLEACRRHDVSPAMLEVEIVETALLEEGPAVQHNLQALRRQGVRIAVDDFGTGYSALSYLHRFEIDHLKIDRSFVALIGDRRDDAPMTRAIALIGQGLSLGVIAEGVETEHQAQVLKAHGCEFAQGYLFGRPAPAESLQALLLQGAAEPR